MSNKVGVALLKYVCPICGQINEDASTIAINSLLTEKAAKKVEDMHNKVVGFSEKPCKECQSYIDKGALFIIGIDPEKSDDMSNPYRTGHLVGINRESEFVKHLPEEYKKKNAIYMDYREMEKFDMINN
jgi:hypothetical protein